MSNLYNRIMSKCEERGISGYRLCKDCGVSPSVLTDLKNGRKKTIQADYANRFSIRLNCSVNYLMTGEEKEKDPTADNSSRVLENWEISVLDALHAIPEDKRDMIVRKLQDLIDIIG